MLGIDRDSEVLSSLYHERDRAVTSVTELTRRNVAAAEQRVLLEAARTNGRSGLPR